jgi:hypothetical protein
VSVRLCQDWIESFLRFTSDTPSPPIFRKWSAISAVAGALQRRVWTVTTGQRTYPNMYILLVAPPGIGKSVAINPTGELWRKVPGVHCAPNSVTRASLLDVLNTAAVKIIQQNGDFKSFHALTVAASEFGVLVPAHDLEFINTLNDLYDAPAEFKEHRRHRNEQVEIDSPILNILGGTQPAYLDTLLPEQAWGMGFTSRVIMVYSAKNIKPKLFNNHAASTKLSDNLKGDLTTVNKLYGEIRFSETAQAELEAWHDKGLPPVPTHSRLQNYNARRIMHILKLSMVSSASRGNDLLIDSVDLTRAQDWLLEAEERMPDIFRDMQGRSDGTVINDLHSFLWKIYAREQKPIHESRLFSFMQTKVPAEKIVRILEVAERSGKINRTAGTEAPNATYVPALDNQYPE